MNKQERLQARKDAFTIWANADGNAKLERIAKETGLTVKQLEKYKVKDKWDKKFKKFQVDRDQQFVDGIKDIKYDGTDSELDEIQNILDHSGLTDRRKLFCLYYLQSYNATQSAIKAGFAKSGAHVRARELLAKDEIKAVLKQISALISENLYITAKDIVDEYIKIAFADITDYVTFNEKGVVLKDSDQVDGRLITEVRQGRDGMTVKLADKMKALERLEKLFDAIPDRRLMLDQQKFELSKELANKADDENGNVTIINDIG